MARVTHVVDLAGATPPWSLALELARTVPPGSWVLVGGLMVHAHCLRAGMTATRPTRDLDVLLDIEVASVSTVAGALVSLGFSPREPSRGSPLHRFERGEDVVDVMVSRDVRVPTRWRLRPFLRAPGAAQALRRRDTYVLVTDGRRFPVDVPDPLGAILAKTAAFSVDSRDPGRHAEDVAVLCACGGPVRQLSLGGLTSKERRRVRGLHAALGDPGHPAWSALEDYDRALGRRVWDAIARAAGA